jgi:hypothetical protein
MSSGEPREEPRHSAGAKARARAVGFPRSRLPPAELELELASVPLDAIDLVGFGANA